jgi:C1A family cysteine protease
VLQGMPWYDAFFTPDRDGFIDADPHWPTSQLAGGHEVEAVGVDLDSRNVFDSAIVYANSWGTGWGDSGYFRMRLSTYERLTSVDLKQYVV